MRYVMLFLVLAALFGCAESQLIGGQRDEHGCLGPAGYSWNADINACARSWELDETDRKAAGIAVESYGPKEGATIAEVVRMKCPGCFVVKIERYGVAEEVVINNWVAETA